MANESVRFKVHKHLPSEKGSLLSIVMVFIVLVFLLQGIFSVYDWARESIYNSVNVDRWFAVHSFEVEDFHLGLRTTEITLHLDRTIKQEMDGHWRVELRKVFESDPNFSIFVCKGSSRDSPSLYTPLAELPDPLTFDWFVDDRGQCSPRMSEGTFVLKAIWNFCRYDIHCAEDGYKTKRLVAISEPFKILPPKVD